MASTIGKPAVIVQYGYIPGAHCGTYTHSGYIYSENRSRDLMLHNQNKSG